MNQTRLKRIILQRIAENEEGTFGVLKYNESPFAVTGELPNLCNLKNRSCIPSGRYICKLVDSKKYGKIFTVLNVTGRTLVRFHWGNIPINDSEGCILVAESFNELNGKQAVTDSKHGMQDFYNIIGEDKEFHIDIIDT